MKWLKKEFEKESSMISKVFGQAEEEGRKEVEILKGKVLQDSKVLIQFLKNLTAKEEVELDHIKTTLMKEVHFLQSKLNKLEKKEGRKVVMELSKLKLRIKKKRIKHDYRKKAIEEINRLQSALQKIKIGIDEQTKELIKKAGTLTREEKERLVKGVKEKHKKGTALLHKEIRELKKVLLDLKRVEKTETRVIKAELEKDVKKIRVLLQKSKIKNEELKTSSSNKLKKFEKTLKKTTKAKEVQIEQAIKQKISSLQKNLDVFIIKEKGQTLRLVHLTLAKLRETGIKAEEGEAGLEKYLKRLFKGLKKEKKTEKQLLKEIALKKLRSLERQKLSPKVFDDFTWILKVFLSNYLNINYEYTHQELVEELTKRKVKHKEDIIKLSEEVVRVNYEGDSLDKEHFQRMVEEAKKVIREI